MKPNRRDNIAQVSAKTISTIAPAAAATVEAENQKHDERLYSLRENVSLIGWMGIISSTTMLLCTGLTMQWSHEMVRYFVYMLRKSFEMERTRVMLRRVVMAVSTSAYFLSAINVLMNMLLLIGVAKLNYKLLLPWLLFHGFLFGLLVHVAMYTSISGLLVDFKIFVILLASYAMIMVIFYKISYEVFHLYKILSRRSLASDQRVVDVEENRKNYMTLHSEA